MKLSCKLGPGAPGKRRALASGVLAALSLLLTASAQAIDKCNALTMYGWGDADKTFKSLSPAGQNLKVAEISDGNPEIHTTFNAATQIHLTVREGATCEGKVDLGGTFPGALTFANPPASGKICSVTIESYRTRLNGIHQGATPGGQTACRAGFLAGKMEAGKKQAYLELCGAWQCQ